MKAEKRSGNASLRVRRWCVWGVLWVIASVGLYAQARPPRVIDVHVHYNGEPGFLDQMLRRMNREDGLAILLVTPKGLPEASRFIHDHPDRFAGFGDVKLDDPDVLERIRTFHEAGFRGLGEITGSLRNYDDPAYWPIYDLANRFHMILLFHTGIVNRLQPEVSTNISFERSRVTRLDLIARHWPSLIVIGAHLGNPDYAEAAEVGRWNPNLYFDVSGTTLLKKKDDYKFFRSIFWWSGLVSPHTPSGKAGAFTKLVFASDIFGGDLAELDTALANYHAMLDACGVPAADQALIFSGTMWKILQAQSAASDEQVTLKRQGDAVEVTIGGRPFTTYFFDPKIAKAYLQPLRTSGGVTVSRSFPILTEVPAEHEHERSLEPHQRPLYFAHGDINGYNFWAEGVFSKYYPAEVPSKWGRMVFRKLEEVQGGGTSGTVRVSFDLAGPDGKRFAEEEQTFTFRGDADTRTVDCTFVLRALDGPVKFGDTKEGTFAIRLAPELTAPLGTMTNSRGGVGEKEVWGKQADWVNVDGTIDGKAVGVAIFDSPESFRHPTYWHARGYGLLAANPFGLSYFLNDPRQDGSYTLTPGKTVTFRYRVLIHEGDSKSADVAGRYGAFVNGR